jgi:hypothetical protein
MAGKWADTSIADGCVTALRFAPIKCNLVGYTPSKIPHEEAFFVFHVLFCG